MDRIMRLFVYIGLLFTISPVFTPCHGEIMTPVERINKRYDDFFRYIREREERFERSQKSNDDRKKIEHARMERLEKARQKYVMERKARPNLDYLRVQYERELKEHQEKMEMLRRRYVEKRDELDQYLKKGRQIPEMKEYELEGY